MSGLDYRSLPVLVLGSDVPDVAECHCSHTAGHGPGCPQHDGSHDHNWCVVHVHGQLTIRCRVCGGRCCSTLYDWEPGRNPCIGLRHHRDYHVFRDGGVEPVGGFWLKGGDAA